MQLGFLNGVTSVVLRVKLRKLSDGSAYSGLDHTSSGLIIAATADNEQGPAAGSGAGFGVAYTSAGSTIETIATVGTFVAPTATKCRFKAVDATNHPGLYEIQLADARWAVSNCRSVNVTVSGVSDLEQVDTVIQLGLMISDVAAALANKLAHVILRRTMANVEGSADGDAINVSSLYGFIQQGQKSSMAGAIWTIKKTDGTTLGTLTPSTDENANPVVGVT